jgi:hypothetical protein
MDRNSRRNRRVFRKNKRRYAGGDEMSTPKTLKELVAQVTPGPWKVIQERIGNTTYPGVIGINGKGVCSPWNHSQRDCNAELIARLSPEVVLRWAELTDATARIGFHEGDERGPCLCSQCQRTKEARSILAALNGITDDKTSNEK